MTLDIVIDDLRTFDMLQQAATRTRDVVYLRTSKAALAYLETSTGCDTLWLDHDLGGDDTVMPVVDWLCERAYLGESYRAKRVNVHSMNPIGAASVVRSLVRYGYEAQRVSLPPLL